MKQVRHKVSRYLDWAMRTQRKRAHLGKSDWDNLFISLGNRDRFSYISNTAIDLVNDSVGIAKLATKVRIHGIKLKGTYEFGFFTEIGNYGPTGAYAYLIPSNRLYPGCCKWRFYFPARGAFYHPIGICRINCNTISWRSSQRLQAQLLIRHSDKHEIASCIP
jgi:hypothetical protein